MKKMMVHPKTVALATMFLALLLTVYSSSVFAQAYPRILREVSTGMSTYQVDSIAGTPTKTAEVRRWFYSTDQVVIVDEEVVDIRISHRTKPEKRSMDSTGSPKRRVSMLRIGMNTEEVFEIAGEPDVKAKGIDYYYTNRHRVEFTNQKVSRIELHIKKGLDILDWIRLNFSKGGLLFMNITLAFIMFGVALEIKIKHFKEVILKPKSFIIGVFSQFVALPALTFLLVLILKPSPSVALGMILVAACPGGNISNFISSLAKANIELSVSLTAMATLLAVFMTPLNFALWGGLYSGTAELVIPIKIDVWEMMKTVFILLGIPIALGILFSNKFPNVTKKIIKPLKLLSLLAFAGFVVAALASNFKFFLEYIHLIILLVFVHNILALTTGYSLASIFGLRKPDRRTLTIETGIQNSGLALVLIFNPNLFDGIGGMAFVAAWWGIWHIIAGLGIASFWSRKPIVKP